MSKQVLQQGLTVQGPTPQIVEQTLKLGEATKVTVQLKEDPDLSIFVLREGKSYLLWHMKV